MIYSRILITLAAAAAFCNDQRFTQRIDGFDENEIHAAFDEVMNPLGMFRAEFVIGRDEVGAVAVFQRGN